MGAKRRQLAERRKAQGFSQEALACELSVDRRTVQRWEGGEADPQPWQRPRLADLLGVAHAELAALLNPRDDPAVSTDRIQYAMAHPMRLDTAAVTALAEALAAQRRADDVVGPVPLIGAALAQRGALLAMVREARGKHRDGLCAVASQASQFAGWLNIELGEYGRATALLNEAVELGDDIEDGALVAQAHNLKGNIARQRGQWNAVHRNFVAAFVSESALRQKVVNGAQAASALAILGRRSEAEKMLREIETLRDKAADEEPPGTAYWLSPEWMSLPIGHVHLNLGWRKQGAEYLRHGLDSLPPEHRHALWTREAWAALEEAESGD